MNHHHIDRRRRFSGHQPAELDGPRGNPPNKGSGGVRDNEYRIQGSLEVHIGRSPTEPEEVERLVRKARAAGVVVFLRADLARMDSMARAMIEAEAARLYGRETTTTEA